MIRDAWWWLIRTAQQYAPPGTWKWTVLTAVGHTLLTLAGLLVHPMMGFGVASWYTGREVEQRVGGSDESWMGSLLDVVGPWLVVWFALR